MKKLGLNDIICVGLVFFSFFTSSFIFPRKTKPNFQSCNVTLEGGTCVGDILTIRSSEPVQSISWILDGIPILDQDISRQNNGIVVAGGNGNGSAANQLYNPNRLFVDQEGILYIPDMANNRIQKWLPGAASGITIAGGNGAGGNANQFNRPTSVTADANGNIYVADQNNSRIQKWVPGAISGVTIATGLNTPTGICLDFYGNLYVSEQNGQTVIKYTNATGPGVVVAGGNGYGGSANQLASPTGIFVDTKNNLYISDTDNYRVQKWTLGDTFGTTVARTNGNPLGVYVDGTDNIYVTDYTGFLVQKFLPNAPNGITIAGGNGQGNSPNQITPAGVWMDKYNNLYVSDFLSGRIIKFSNIYTGTYTAVRAGIYTAKITTISGCVITSNPITIKDKAIPQIDITVDKTIACIKFPPIFTSNIGSGGSSPSLQWKVNGINVPNANTATFSSANLTGNDVVSCSLTNLDPCVSSSIVQSNTIRLQNAVDLPSVQISLDINEVCKGSLQTFKAQTSNAGTNPIYQWKLNGIPISRAQNSPIFKSNQFKDSDVISCTIISDAQYCQASSTAISNEVNVKIKLPISPKVTISTSEKKIYEGLNVTFTANSENHGDYPIYTWKINDEVAYVGEQSFTTNKLKNGDQVVCFMNISMPCVTTNTSASNSILINVIKIEKVIPPNTFTPNGDGINDLWNIDELRMFPNCSVRIFSRSGIEVFNSTGYKQPWDGHSKGKPCLPGVYYYLINLDERQQLSGSLTIIK